MNTNNLIRLFWFNVLTIGIVLVANSFCVGQQDNPKLQLATYALKHINAEQALGVASTMLQGESHLRLDVMTEQNMVIAHGAPETLVKLKSIFEDIDKEKQVDPTEVRVYRLSNLRAEEAANLLAGLFAREQASSIRIAGEEASNSLVVSSKKADFEALESLIKELDSIKTGLVQTSPENVVVRVSWLVDADALDTGSLRDFLRTPISSLNELVVGLKQSDLLQSAKTLTQTQTTVQVDPSNRRANEFNSASARKVDGRMIEMSCLGQVTQSPNGNYKINVNLTLVSDVTQNVGSTIELPKNHPVAFSISDVGEFKSAAVVEILDSK